MMNNNKFITLGKAYSAALLAVTVLILSACASNPKVSSYVETQLEQGQALTAINGTRFDNAFGQAKTSTYKTLHIAPLDLSTVEIDEQRLEFDERGWAFTEAEIARYQAYVQKRAAEVFDGDASVQAQATAQGADLVANIKVLEFMPSAPKDDSHSRIARTKYYTRGIGLMQIVIELTDSKSGELVAIFEDSEEVGEDAFGLERNDRVNNQRFMRLELSRWLNKLEDAVSQLNKA